MTSHYIEAASNIENSKILIAVRGEEATSLLELDLTTGKAVDLGKVPNEREDVIAILNLKTSAVVLTQWTQGGGLPAHVRVFEQKTWLDPKAVPCLTFDQVSMKADQLILECRKSEGVKEASVRLGLPVRGELADQVLPLSSAAIRASAFKLTGPNFHRSGIETKSGEKWSSHSADEVLRSARAQR